MNKPITLSDFNTPKLKERYSKSLAVAIALDQQQDLPHNSSIQDSINHTPHTCAWQVVPFTKNEHFYSPSCFSPEGTVNFPTVKSDICPYCGGTVE